MRSTLRLAPVFLLAVCFLVQSCQTPDAPTVILTNANAYTFAWSDPSGDGDPAADAPFENGNWKADASAIVLSGSQIVFVGSTSEALELAGPDTEIIDLEGATVIPGAIESHGHVHELGEHNEQLDLTPYSTPEEIVDLVVKRAEQTPAGEWIIGWGWDEGAWADQLPNWDLLNARVTDHPVVLKGRRGFGAWGNRSAFEQAGVTEESANPDGGEYVRNSDGHLTGVALNNAVDSFYDKIPETTLDQRKRILLYGLSELANSGFVAAHHAGVRTDYMPAYEALASSGELPIRTHLMLAAVADNAALVNEWIEKGPTKDRGSMLQVRGVKAYYDGSLGSRGARLLADYSDMPGHRGVSGTEYGFDEELVSRTMQAGFQTVIHAIGDEGNRHVLDFYESVFDQHPETSDNMHRVEHAQIVALEDIPRFGRLNLVASMEPGHTVEDSPWTEDRIGPERAAGAYAWRTLRQTGATLIFNSDYSGTDHSLLYGLYCATTRQQRDGTPAGGWYPEQRMTIEEAVRAYTVWPARASGIENLTGTLEAGKWADLTVLNVDVMQLTGAESSALLNGEVVMTIIAGHVLRPKTRN